MQSESCLITKDKLDQLAEEIEMGCIELQRIGRSCRRISEELQQMSRTLHSQIISHLYFLHWQMPEYVLLEKPTQGELVVS